MWFLPSAAIPNPIFAHFLSSSSAHFTSWSFLIHSFFESETEVLLLTLFFFIPLNNNYFGSKPIRLNQLCVHKCANVYILDRLIGKMDFHIEHMKNARTKRFVIFDVIFCNGRTLSFLSFLGWTIFFSLSGLDSIVITINMCICIFFWMLKIMLHVELIFHWKKIFSWTFSLVDILTSGWVCCLSFNHL